MWTLVPLRFLQFDLAEGRLPSLTPRWFLALAATGSPANDACWTHASGGDAARASANDTSYKTLFCTNWN